MISLCHSVNVTIQLRLLKIYITLINHLKKHLVQFVHNTGLLGRAQRWNEKPTCSSCCESSYHCFCSNCYILITSTSDLEHLKTLDRVLERLETVALRLKKEKRILLQSQQTTWVMNNNGLHPTEQKMKDIKEAPRPKNAICEMAKILSEVTEMLRKVLS